MVEEKERRVVVQCETRRECGLTVKYELRYEQGVYSLLCIAFDRDGCCGFDYIFDVAERGDSAEEILRIIADNFVTPISLREVLEDLL